VPNERCGDWLWLMDRSLGGNAMNRVAERTPADPAGGRSSTAIVHDRAATTGNRTLPRPLRRGPGTGVTKLERWFLRRILHRLGHPPIQIALWNGETVVTSSTAPV